MLALLIGVPTYLALHHAPSCQDGVKNGTEEGVDCGGSCPNICSFKVADPIVHWSRSVSVVPGVYTALALVENTNDSYQALSVPYSFQLRDAQNILIAEQTGTLELPPHTIVPVFETGIKTGERIPAHTTFLIAPHITWTHSAFSPPDVSVLSRALSATTTSPRLSVRIRNNTLATFLDLPVVAALYDASDNLVHASRTVIPELGPTGDRDIVFTWPAPFAAPVARIDVTPVFPLSP